MWHKIFTFFNSLKLFRLHYLRKIERINIFNLIRNNAQNGNGSEKEEETGKTREEPPPPHCSESENTQTASLSL